MNQPLDELYELAEAPAKLRMLAEWLSITDRLGQGKEVQQDLRTWADDIDLLLAERQEMQERIKKLEKKVLLRRRHDQ